MYALLTGIVESKSFFSRSFVIRNKHICRLLSVHNKSIESVTCVAVVAIEFATSAIAAVERLKTNEFISKIMIPC